MQFKSIFIFSVFSFLAQVSSATGGFYCIAGDYDRDGFVFEISGATTRGFMSPVLNANGRMVGELGDDGSQSEVNETFSESDIMQYWNYQQTFKIILYKDMVFDATGKATKKPVVVVIETTAKSDSDVEFEGQVHFGDSQEFPASMPITCSLE